MAFRTPEQQEAYNAKRRAETAAKKAAKTVVAKAKPIGKPKAKRKSETATVAAKVPAKRKVIGHARTAPEDVREALKLKAVAEHKEKFPPKHDLPAQVKTLGADSLLPPQEGSPAKHTMARSYLRSGAPGMGKLRGKNYQTTVSFTEDQMKQVVTAAGFRGVSLAEMIRSCVVEHLNAHAAVQS